MWGFVEFRLDIPLVIEILRWAILRYEYWVILFYFFEIGKELVIFLIRDDWIGLDIVQMIVLSDALNKLRVKMYKGFDKKIVGIGVVFDI